MDKDTRSRKWFITINNPSDKGYIHEVIKERLEEIGGRVVYWCMADEVGESGTYHTHIYLYSENALRFSTIQKAFYGGAFEMAKGTSQQCRDYVFAEGKHKNKSGTNLEETREESGECPIEQQGKRNDIYGDLYALVKEGLSDYALLELEPGYAKILPQIDRIRQIVRAEKFRKEFRKMAVEYICGEPGAGKTRGTYERFGADNLYRVTDPNHPFDGYNGQDVLVFEEFRSSLFKIQEMLNYLDGHPLDLPARYGNKVACYTQVIFLTNIPLEKQYVKIQQEYPDTWKAFLRRIHLIKVYKGGEVQEYGVDEYLSKHQQIGQAVTLSSYQSNWVDNLFKNKEGNDG